MNASKNYTKGEINEREISESDFEYYLENSNIHLGYVPYFTKDNIFIYSNRIMVNRSAPLNYDRCLPKRTRQDIKRFSKNSRRRLIKTLSMINLQNYFRPYFFTTTFHEWKPETPTKLKIFLDNFLKRIKYKYPDCSYLWKLEFQKRKMPHFHFIFLVPKKIKNFSENKFKQNLKDAWFYWLKDKSLYSFYYSTKFEKSNNKKYIFQYIAKYTAKEETENNFNYPGRRYGYSQNLDLSPEDSFSITQEAVEQIAEKIFQYLKGKQHLTDEFIDNLFHGSSFSVLLSSDESWKLLKENLLDHNPLFTEIPPVQSNWYERTGRQTRPTPS